MKVNKTIVFLFLFTLCAATPSFSKRMPSPHVQPIVKDGIEYSAPPDSIGFVVASWMNENEEKQEIWRRQIYTIKYKHDIEYCLQEVYIEGLKFDNGKLIILNEAGGQFELDIDSLDVKVISGESVINTRRWGFW